MKDKFMGVDLSLTATGICIIDEDFLENRTIVFSETLRNKLSGFERWLYIEKRIEEIIEEYSPRIIAIEGYAYGGYRTIDMAELGGIIKKKIYETGIDMVTLSTSQVKKIITGKGIMPKHYNYENTKEWIIEKIRRNYGINFTIKQHNEADAFGLAFSVLCLMIYKKSFMHVKYGKNKKRALTMQQIDVCYNILSKGE